jgi:hypothetical protein
MLDYANTNEPDDTLARAIAAGDDTRHSDECWDATFANYGTSDYATECGCAWDEVGDDA